MSLTAVLDAIPADTARPEGYHDGLTRRASRRWHPSGIYRAGLISPGLQRIAQAADAFAHLRLNMPDAAAGVPWGT